MKNTKIAMVLCSMFSLTMVACGGDDGGSSGVSDSKVIGTLSASEAMAVCIELTEIFPERTVDCGGGVTLTVGNSSSDCGSQPPATCTATVGQLRDCFGDLSDLTDAQWCSDTTQPPASCAPVFAAECSGG